MLGRPFLARLGRALSDRRGSTATLFATAVPMLAVGACGAIDLSSVWNDRSALQDAADSAALDAAKQIGVTSAAGIGSRADAFVQASVPDVYARLGAQVTTTVAPDGGSVRVDVSGHRMSFFGNLLPPGGWSISTSATALPAAGTPLCVLSLDETAANPLQLSGTSSITATACRVQGNSSVLNGGAGWLKALDVQATDSASGNISPAPQTGAPVVIDPFRSTNFNIPSTCADPPVSISTGTLDVDPGVHCGQWQVTGDALVTLKPGDHYFVGGGLWVQQTATLKGSDVSLAFSADSNFKFVGQSSVDLEGRRSGSFAGFLIVTDPGNAHSFTIQSKNVTRLYGTIYLPNAELSVSGTGGGQVAKQSAWTVVIAKQLTTKGSQELVINSAYSGSAVPVPNGVGPRSSGCGQVRLAR